MNAAAYQDQLAKCVRCGVCKTLCPTYHTTFNESMGARGRISLLGELSQQNLSLSRNLADRIFSCMLCSACKGVCPTGIDIPEVIYHGRSILKKTFKRGRLLRRGLRFGAYRPDAAFNMFRLIQKFLLLPVPGAKRFRHLPRIASRPFNKNVQVYKNMKKLGRIAIFAGCNVNYFYPLIGDALSRVLLSSGYETVVFRGEMCCGAPLRSAGMEEEAAMLARKNVEHFSKVRAKAIVSLCPTCTMVIRDQYPSMIGETIRNIMDTNEFLAKFNIISGLQLDRGKCTYHDPCHLSFGLGIRKLPREILRSIRGIDLVEMAHADDCCGFAGLFSFFFNDISRTISNKKIKSIKNTKAETVVTSCPGCIMQLETMIRQENLNIDVRHIIEIIDSAMG